MSYGWVWAVIAVTQGTLLVLVGVLWGVGRSRRATTGSRGDAPRRAAAELARSTPDEAAGILASLAPSDAVQALSLYCATPDERCEAVVRCLRTEQWVRGVIEGARSRLWWKRLAAARLLCVIAGESDRETIRALLLDAHPAVQSAATACLLRYADEDLVALVIDSLSNRSSAVRAYQAGVLARRADIAAPILLGRLRADAPPHKLYAYIYAAEALDIPQCRGAVAELSTHPHPEVRVAVARVLKQPRDERTRVKLLSMLRDGDWRVRAQAARGLTGAADEHTLQELTRALTDSTWWVRFRAALTLAGLGGEGRAALASARTLPDRYARDMATLVSELPDATVAELAAG